jgi:GNAT superfamily N-acetyltransferase
MVVELAAAHEAAVLLAMREEAARWLQSRGIEQWTPGEVSLDEVRGQVDAGEWFVLRRNGSPVAGLRLLAADDQMWGPRPTDAAYVHGLVVDRRCAGERLGAALLRWAACRAHASGLSYLRLDCVESNTALRARVGEASEAGERSSTPRVVGAVALRDTACYALRRG